eukprot:jgi/Botrbrau1/6867/Bobra.152_2s0025.1
MKISTILIPLCAVVLRNSGRVSSQGFAPAHGYASNAFVMPAEAPSMPESRVHSRDGAKSSPYASRALTPPFEHNFTSKRLLAFYGLQLANSSGLPAMISDPAFGFPSVSIFNLFVWQVADGPCGAFDFVAYSVASFYKGAEETIFKYHTTHTWSSKAECCGSGTIMWYACQLSVFKWNLLPGGQEQLAIYAPQDLESPILTISWWIPLPNLLQRVPDSPDWPKFPEWFGFWQWVADDIASTTNGTDANGRPIIVGHVNNHWSFYDNKQTFAIFQGFGGPQASDLTGFVIPFGAIYPDGGRVNIRVTPLA